MPQVHNKYKFQRFLPPVFRGKFWWITTVEKDSAFSARHCQYSEHSVNSQESEHAPNRIRTIPKHPLATIYPQSVGYLLENNAPTSIRSAASALRLISDAAATHEQEYAQNDIAPMASQWDDDTDSESPIQDSSLL